MHQRILLLVALALCASGAATAQQPAPAGEAVVLTIDDALEIALERNYVVRDAALEVLNAQAQVREAWGQLMPQVDATGSYTRNVVAPNPFAGSDAGGLFEGLSVLDWLAYNEGARTDGDPGTEPISLDEFRRRQSAGFEQAGLSMSASDNPFAVPNQFVSQISITQTLYSGAAFAAVRGARSLREINEAALTQQQHRVVHQTREQFYAALLAQQQAEIARASASRAEATLRETARLVAAGTMPLFERLSAEVEVTNLQTQFVQAENAAAIAASNLLFALGLPVGTPVRLQGALGMPDDQLFHTIAAEDALLSALDRRPEVQQARLAVDLQEVNRDITRAGSRPVVSAFANLGLQGNVPDNRTVIRQGTTPGDPFSVSAEERSFFDSNYWNPSVAVGARVTWNLFDGFQTRYRVQQNTIAIEQARVQLEQASQLVLLEVEQAIRNITSARQRIVAQAENVDRAETAFEFASTRLATGVATQVDVRLASGQLDQARLGYLQAVYDYLVARSDLQRATGLILPDPAPATTTLLTTAD